jgi:hypothetical protein
VNPYLIEKTYHPDPDLGGGPRGHHSWDVGHYDGQFVVLREFETLDQAAAFLHYLNGGLQDETRLARSLERVADALQIIQRMMPR